jgi:hypothetical protein
MSAIEHAEPEGVLDHPEALPGALVDVEPESQLVHVVGLRSVHVGHGDDD